MMNQPCDWTINLESATCDTAALRAMESDAQRAQVIDLAVYLLWTWTGRRLGLCETTVRPCRAGKGSNESIFWGGFPSTSRAGYAGSWIPVLLDGKWFNIGCSTCSDACGCDRADALRLPGPVGEVAAVWVGGEVLPTSAYHLSDGVLYRIDGEAWPEGNDPVAPLDQLGTKAWGVTYKRGTEVSSAGKLATAILANELAKAVCDDRDCALPQRVQSITRQGVSVAVLDSFEDLKDGRTGIWLVDSWVAAESATRTSPPAVYSPDVQPGAGTEFALGFGR